MWREAEHPVGQSAASLEEVKENMAEWGIDPALLVRSIPADTPLDTVYRVERTQTVTMMFVQQIQLVRGSEFKLGRYGTANVNAWLRADGLQITLAREGAKPAPLAPVEKLAVAKDPKRRGGYTREMRAAKAAAKARKVA